MKKGSRKEKKRKDRKTNSEQVLTCEHTVSGYWKEKEKEKKERRKRKGEKDKRKKRKG